jgi:phage FluMu protein Com
VSEKIYFTCDCYGSKGALFASPRNTGNRMICAYCGKEMKEISMKQWLNSKGKYCIWIQDGYWFTGCGEKYATDDRVQYCPHCGKFVKRITIKQEHISVVNNSEKENQNEF